MPGTGVVAALLVCLVASAGTVWPSRRLAARRSPPELFFALAPLAWTWIALVSLGWAFDGLAPATTPWRAVSASAGTAALPVALLPFRWRAAAAALVVVLFAFAAWGDLPYARSFGAVVPLAALGEAWRAWGSAGRPGSGDPADAWLLAFAVPALWMGFSFARPPLRGPGSARAAAAALGLAAVAGSWLSAPGASADPGSFDAVGARVDDLRRPGAALRGPRLRPPAGLVVAHALGGIGGYAYTNSREAFLASYAAGVRWFEADLALTSDGWLVAFHPGHERALGLPVEIGRVDRADFLSRRVRGRFTPLDLEALLDLLVRHEDAFLVTDTKQWTPETLAAFERALARRDPALRRRIVPQLYREEDLLGIQALERRLGPFPYLVLATYQLDLSDDEIARLVRRRGLRIVSVHVEDLGPGLAGALHEVGASLLVHPVNDPRQREWVLRRGADGIFTHFLLAATGEQRPSEAHP